MSENKGNVVQYFDAVNGFADIFHGQNFVSDIAGRAEVDIGIFTAGRTDFIQLDFFERAFSGRRLFGF